MEYVYIIKCEAFHKIGWTISIAARLRDLSVGNPFELTLVQLFSFTNARAVETVLHQAFSSKRVRGEWFTLDSTDINKIISLCLDLGGQPQDVNNIHIESSSQSIYAGSVKECLDEAYNDDERVLTSSELVSMGFDKSTAWRHRNAWLQEHNIKEK